MFSRNLERVSAAAKAREGRVRGPRKDRGAYSARRNWPRRLDVSIRENPNCKGFKRSPEIYVPDFGTLLQTVKGHSGSGRRTISLSGDLIKRKNGIDPPFLFELSLRVTKYSPTVSFYLSKYFSYSRPSE